MTEPHCSSLSDVLDQLDRVAPNVPLLALGQTIFWDEPMKAGVATALKRAGSERRLVAGVHDTDYFAKLPNGRHQAGKFQAFPHNDTTTRGLWSAAGEFSTLFGSETVVTREILAKAGLRVDRVLRDRPAFLDSATEAWGWKGIVSLEESPPITAEVPLRQLLPTLLSTFDWALDSSLACLAEGSRALAEPLVEKLRERMCALADDPSLTVSSYYRKLLPEFYEFCANVPVDLDATTTTELLRFNTKTCDLPRFELTNLFVNHETREIARNAYDAAIRGSAGLYELARFGSGAIPFDLYIPGQGRGTIRLGTRGAVIMTRSPQFLSFRKPLTGVRDLAELVEAKFGPNCVLVGKAVSLIGMLGREFVFVFHEGASSYVKHSARMHRSLAEAGYALHVHPILRLRYDAWTALGVCCSWLRLPEPFERAFGAEELCAPSFATRWKSVADGQRALLKTVGSMRRPIELIRFLDETVGGSWNRIAEEYLGLHERLEVLDRDMRALRDRRKALYAELESLKLARQDAEHALGEHFRAKIFDRDPHPEDIAERKRLHAVLEGVLERRRDAQAAVGHLRREQQAVAEAPEVKKVHERRRSMELEAELKRARIIRGAVAASSGLSAAAVRPGAWWFRLVCPDGLWFRETVESAECYLEPLV